jgi:hypothetical protein
MSIWDYVPGRQRFYAWCFGKGMRAILGDGDAVCLVPFDDGLLARKRGYYQKNLVGNLPGYETADGDMFITDGDGDAVFTLQGVPVVLCVDPSKMAAAAHPLKALIGHKADMGEYIRVDRQDSVVSRGKALERVDDDDPDIANESPLFINEDAHDELYDLSPPARLDSTQLPDDGDVTAVADGSGITRADGYVVSVNKAAELVPNPPTSREIKIMQQRERNAAMDNSEIIKYIGIGALIGGIGVLAGVGVYAAASGLL